MAKTFFYEKEHEDSLADRVRAIRFSPPLRAFIRDAAQFMKNYLPMDIEPITDVFSQTVHQIDLSHNLSLDVLISKDPPRFRQKLAECNLAGALKSEYGKLLKDQGPIIDLCIDGLFNAKLGD